MAGACTLHLQHAAGQPAGAVALAAGAWHTVRSAALMLGTALLRTRRGLSSQDRDSIATWALRVLESSDEVGAVADARDITRALHLLAVWREARADADEERVLRANVQASATAAACLCGLLSQPGAPVAPTSTLVFGPPSRRRQLHAARGPAAVAAASDATPAASRFAVASGDADADQRPCAPRASAEHRS